MTTPVLQKRAGYNTSHLYLNEELRCTELVTISSIKKIGLIWPNDLEFYVVETLIVI
ncbi:hypothetical protein LBMAG26_15600 [Bacteroidota bacterium]|nr:hypothetical protein LBMAG26_15600 [Bacteroidota bacterium]